MARMSHFRQMYARFRSNNGIPHIPVLLGEIENGTIEMKGNKTGYNIGDSVILFEPFIVEVKENKDWIN